MSRHLNLLPSSSVRRRAIRESLAVWSRVLLVALVGCAGLAGWEVWNGQQISQSLTSLEAQHAPIVQLQEDIVELKAKITALSVNQQLALELASSQSMVTLVGELGVASAHAGGDLFVESMEFERQLAVAGGPATQIVRLTGAALDHLAVTRFVEALRGANLFAEVQLTSTGSQTLASQSVTSFDVECVVY